VNIDPCEGFINPCEGFVDPCEGPARDLSTPAMDLSTPVRELLTLARDISTPAMDLSTPVMDLSTPARDLSTPAMDLSTPARCVHVVNSCAVPLYTHFSRSPSWGTVGACVRSFVFPAPFWDAFGSHARVSIWLLLARVRVPNPHKDEHRTQNACTTIHASYVCIACLIYVSRVSLPHVVGASCHCIASRRRG